MATLTARRRTAAWTDAANRWDTADRRQTTQAALTTLATGRRTATWTANTTQTTLATLTNRRRTAT